MIRRCTLAFVVTSVTALHAAPPVNGARAFLACQSCHALTPERGGKSAPGLGAVMGRPIASAPDFAYSAALKAKGGVWDAASLDAWLASPRSFAPGTSMANAGERDPGRRRALIAYLGSLSVKKGGDQ